MLMLSLEEMDWTDSQVQDNHVGELSGNLYELINLKMFFHAHLTKIIVQRLYSINKVVKTKQQKQMLHNLKEQKKMFEEFLEELQDDDLSEDSMEDIT
jgi:cell division protein FtsB